jgi:CubicO group peptidase (beta-lactamase class C family)
MKRLVLMLLAFLVASSPLFAQQLDVDAFATYARESFDTYEVPGAAIAIVKDGELVFARGFGVRTLGGPTPVDADTLFAIASMTKAFGAAVLATLVDEGKLSWDDRVIDQLPDFRVYDPYATRELTVRDLLSHRSGNASQAGDLLWLRSTFTREEIVHRIRFIEPAYGFRARYGYQNVMFIAAGELAEAVSGESWDELVAKRIFEPLGMTRTNTTIRMRDDGGNWATPHVPKNGEILVIDFENVDNLGAAGAINSSANDLSRWLLLQLGRGTLGDVRVFSEEQSEQMWTPHTVLSVGNPSPSLASREPLFAAYGLGWRLRDYRDRKIVYHSGGLAGMTSLTTLVPEDNLGIVVLTNSETSAQTAVTYWALDRYFGAPDADWTALQREDAEKRWVERLEPMLEAVEKSRIASTSPSLTLSDYAGRYSDPLIGDALVEETEGSLTFQLVRSPPFHARLEHWHYDTFVARFDHHSVKDAFVTFALGPDGAVESMHMKRYSPFAESTYGYEALRFVPLPVN